MRRLLKQRLLTAPAGCWPIINGGSAPVTIVAEDRTDIQVSLEGAGLRWIPERAILRPARNEHIFFQCDRLWKWGGRLTAVTVHIPACGSLDSVIEVYTRDRITMTGPVGYAILKADGSIKVEEVPSNSLVSATTLSPGSPIKVGKTSGRLYAYTIGGSVEVEADNPVCLHIGAGRGDIKVHGRWDDQALDNNGGGHVTFGKDT